MSLDLDAIKARCVAVRRVVTGDEWRATHHPNGWHVEGAREEHPVIRDLRETVVQTWHGSRGEALADFVAHARTDVPALVSEVERLRLLVRSQMVAAGPYMVTQWTDDIQHVDPCDCDLDDETAGDRCMANSEWTYAVVVDGGAFAPRPIVKLPRRSPEQCEEDHIAPLVAMPCCG